VEGVDITWDILV